MEFLKLSFKQLYQRCHDQPFSFNIFGIHICIIYVHIYIHIYRCIYIYRMDSAQLYRKKHKIQKFFCKFYHNRRVDVISADILFSGRGPTRFTMLCLSPLSDRCGRFNVVFF